MDYFFGSKVKLRAMEPSDVELFYKWENDMANWFDSGINAPFSRMQLEQFVLNDKFDIYQDKQIRLMIEIESGDTIGAIDLFHFSALNLRAEIGILIDPDFRGRGYAKDALQVMLRYADEFLNLHQIYCYVNENNEPSKSVFKKLDFVHSGTRKKWNRTENGEWSDILLFQHIFDKENKK